MFLQSHRVDATDRIMKKPELKFCLPAKQALALPRVQARQLWLLPMSMLSVMSARSTPSDKNDGRGSPNSATSPSTNHSSDEGSNEISWAWMHADLAWTIRV
tara:strand:+ start:2220 stop:2525 length:306 start_codon:yes stop_codon:yes gene_type:complete